MTILIVEDEPLIGEVLVQILEDEGYRVSSVSNGFVQPLPHLRDPRISRVGLDERFLD